jgi:hypothetical protein
LPCSLLLIDVSENQLAELQHRSMPELTKLYLGKNWLSGGVPPELDSCDKLHLLDPARSRHVFVAGDFGTFLSLEISLNLPPRHHRHPFTPPPHRSYLIIILILIKRILSIKITKILSYYC